jgi:predicted PurR-regulated permease PerM
MEKSRFSLVFLILLLLLISGLFLAMIRSFLVTLLLAAIFAGLAYPFYRRMLRFCRGRRALASSLTLLLLLTLILVPLTGLLGIVANEAFNISESARPWITAQLQEPDAVLEQLERLPGFERLAPFRDPIFQKAGELVGKVSGFLFDSLSATTRGTVSFLFHFFLLLYALFFFLMDGPALLRKILYYMPLENDDEQRMVDKFTSVTRATIKGTLLIGVAQGSLAGIAFAIVGIDGAVFWGTLMTLLSVIPGIGTALVWAPAAIIMLAMGKVWQGVFLLIFCGLIVGSIDNVLRPRLVGRDTQMHELLILFGTLGGIMLFGVLGFIIGPILAALFVTIWEIYGIAFQDYLPPVAALEPAVPLPAEEGAHTDMDPQEEKDEPST